MRWNKEEITFLKENYPYTSDIIISKRLNRSVYAIRTKANKYLKLKKYKKCLDCGVDIIGHSPTILRCNICSKTYNKFYKKKWAESNIETLRIKQALWRIKNYKHRQEMGKLWRLKNREKKRADDKAYYSKIKELRPTPKCVDCSELLPGKSLKTKRCSNCNKLHKVLKLREHRNNNREHCRELNRKYIKNRRDKENQRRIKLGLPLIGNNFKKEQELLFYIKNLFPDKTIIYHDRAILGNGWELDIFIPELNLAFEYYGRQHFDFKSTGYWKDYEEFEAQKLRDELKRVLCKVNQITLIEVYYYEKLDEQLILERLFEKNISPNQSQLLVYNKNRYEIKSKEGM